jgi:hypothetical protein
MPQERGSFQPFRNAVYAWRLHECGEISMERLEQETGIEPATKGLGSRYSTIELLLLSPPSTADLAWEIHV